MDKGSVSLDSERWTDESWVETVTLCKRYIKQLCLVYIILLLWALNDPLFPRIDWFLDCFQKLLSPRTAPSVAPDRPLVAAVPAKALKILPEELAI